MRKSIKENNDYIYLTIMTIFVVLFLGTFFHDPLLHSLIARINGWEISDYTSSLMTGQTTAIATVSQVTHASTFSFWLYYMFPALFIYIITLLVVIIKPERLIISGGFILLSTNLASLNPQIPGSDSFNAVQLLVTRGWSEAGAYALHFIMLGIAIVILGLYIYIGTENNPEDAKGRVKNIIH